MHSKAHKKHNTTTACMCLYTELSFHPWMHRGKWHMREKKAFRSLRRNSPIRRRKPANPSGHTAMQHTHTHRQPVRFTQISSQATGSTSQMLMRLWEAQHRRPRWSHWLLTGLNPLSCESDHCRQAYCYMRGLVLAKTKQQNCREWNPRCNYSVPFAFRVFRIKPT